MWLRAVIVFVRNIVWLVWDDVQPSLCHSLLFTYYVLRLWSTQIRYLRTISRAISAKSFFEISIQRDLYAIPMSVST